MEHDTQSYLDRLRFDPKMLLGKLAAYIGNIRIVILLIIAIAVGGIYSYINLPQRLNPEIKIPIIIVSTVLPGAGSEDIEKLITIPLENKLRGLTGLDTISSVSQDNVSVISMQFLNAVGQDKAKIDVKEAVDTVTNLPTNAKTPSVIALDFENQPVWQFTISGSGDLTSLYSFARHLREVVRSIPTVDSVAIRGLEDEEIAIDILPEKITQYALNPITLSQAISAGISSYPAGTVETSKNSFSVTIEPEVTSIEDIRNLRLIVDGITVRLGDIAMVQQRSALNQPASYIASNQLTPSRTVTFSIFKRSNADIVKTADKVRETVETELKHYEGAYTLTNIINSGEMIRTQFTDLLGEFQTTILLVFFTLLLFLGLRQALIATITVPLTFLSAFIFMSMLGMSINFLSLFAFLLSLGLLVDDTIVVVSAMTSYYKSGKFSPLETGLLVWNDTIIPIWSTTITTIWSFVPLLLASGIIGEFIKPIPVVVTVTMISSTAIAVLITLPIMIILLKPSVPGRSAILGRLILIAILLGGFYLLFHDHPLFLILFAIYIVLLNILWHTRRELTSLWEMSLRKSQNLSNSVRFIGRLSDHGIINVDGFAAAYARFIERILHSKTARRFVILSIVIYAIFSFALLPLGFVKNEFFPKEDAELVYMNLELPAGTSLTENQKETTLLLDKYRNTPNTEFLVADIGTQISGGFGSASDLSNTTQFTFHLPKKENRSQTSTAIAEALRKDTSVYSKGKLSVVELSGGPPAGSDIQLKLSGDDLETLNTITDQVALYLASVPGIINVEKSIKPGTSALVFVPNRDTLSELGISTQSLGLWLRTAASGFTLSEVQFDERTIDKTNVVFSFGDEHLSPEKLGSIMIPSSRGTVHPLLSLGRLETRANPTLISREKGKRTLSVSAGVREGYSIADANKKALDYANTIDLPPGYEWATGGVNEENEKSVQSILAAMIVAFILILVTMVIQFQSFRQALIVLLVIPLAVSSVFLIFAITGTPLSFPALIGVLSLFGIVVTNSMFIVDKININLRQGMPYIRAIADAGASRMEPIILTKLCTVFGLLPITIADPLWRGLGGAIISGLLIASTIMLLFIPVVYYSWMGGDRKILVDDGRDLLN